MNSISAFDDARDFYGRFLASRKRFDQGLAERRRAVELNPYGFQHNLLLAQTLYYNRRHDEAFDQLRTTLLQISLISATDWTRADSPGRSQSATRQAVV